MKLCARCGERPPITNRHRYCSGCRDEADREYALRNRALSKARETPERRRERYQREAEKGRASPRERGYDAAHYRLRKEWKARIAAGDVPCATCDELISPNEKWYLDHTKDRAGYRGPIHQRCSTNGRARALTKEELARRRAYRAKLYDAAEEKRARLYPPEHARLRKEWEPRVATGTVLCPRCLGRIPSDAPWDLGHDDYDWNVWTGPEHQSCSRRAGGRRTAQRRIVPAITSRDWLPAAEGEELPTMTSRAW